jgi:hypothetical protein
MGMFGEGDLALRHGQEGVTMPGRHGQPPLSIEIQRGRPVKHGQSPRSVGAIAARKSGHKCNFQHLIALFCTVAAIWCFTTRERTIICNEINNLEAECNVSIDKKPRLYKHLEE